MKSRFQDPRFEPELRLLTIWNFTCSPNGCVGFLRVVQGLPTYDHAKLPHRCECMIPWVA